MSDLIKDLPRISAVSAVAPARGESLRASVFVAPIVPATDAASTPPDQRAVSDAVNKLNQHFAEKHTDLKFRIDDVLKSVVVSVVDAQDGTVLQQIPSEVALRIAQYLAEDGSGLVKAKA
jgi:flagellar protein FlaG